MDIKELKNKKIPDASGVYFFLGAKKEILYIGKATSLSNRVRSYFDKKIEEKRSPLIAKMIKEAKVVDYTVTDSVLEALILETNLIRTHKPKYNTRSKDDKSYNHLVITDEEFPRILVVRGKDLTEKFTDSTIKYEFGPFTSGTLLKEALKIVQKIFKFYDTKTPVGQEKSKLTRGKIDFNRQIGLYPDKVTKAEYARTVRHIKLFFEGKKDRIVAELDKEMMTLAKQNKFEKANELKKRIFALNHIQDIALIKKENKIYRDEKRIRIEAFDIAHLQGSDMVGVMTVIEGEEPLKSDYRKFKINTVSSPNDTAALKEILERRIQHTEWPLPNLIVMDGSVAQKNVAEKTIKGAGLMIPVVAVVKDERHRPNRIIGPKNLIDSHKNSILLANSESHRFAISYHRNKSRKSRLK